MQCATFFLAASALAAQSVLPPSEVARLETGLIKNASDLSARTRLLVHYFQGAAQPRLQHIVWVVKNRPESKLAGSPFVRITPHSTELSTRSDYEAVRLLWMAGIERHPDSPAVLANAGRFFESGEPTRAAELLQRAFRLDPENKMRRAELMRLYTRMVSSCDPPRNTCPDPVWLQRARSELDNLRHQ